MARWSFLGPDRLEKRRLVVAAESRFARGHKYFRIEAPQTLGAEWANITRAQPLVSAAMKAMRQPLSSISLGIIVGGCMGRPAPRTGGSSLAPASSGPA